MDRQLADALNQCSSTNGVVGMVCTDKSGLCLKATGGVNASTAGYYRSIIEKATTLLSKNEAPKITIETDTSLTNLHSIIVVRSYRQQQNKPKVLIYH
ncbi:hypothetical protein PPL_00399 [Heterostelium album PN500]|uniref:Late endosomal/lysosomal adaptor and MAPK and MTOR activator 5 n=1 Tax=Heterostelium pallidum (strain ATCC 26659 / Pp 5 / PN500) TaxID=670386 RepID=D3AWC5_HETP5|nr:hypothetical protein PPL_00399 [Heterostelium album PN500]EFA86598.1 hypothetical protein PPL_00399 [Heterostelium album PN500]|eukprot:XP_020438703.1 hypothetical protein PPL_00399 [Heterostelium album PN500]